MVTLLEYITVGEIECSNALDGTCILPDYCNKFTALEDYYFRFNMTGADGMYMRVPLAAFATNQTGGNVRECRVEVTYLDVLSSQSQGVLLGGMFFQEFFGVFVNNYTDVMDVTQSARFHVGQNSLYGSYIGNVEFAQGPNPFIPQPDPVNPDDPGDDTSISAVWVVVLVVLCVGLMALLGFSIYKWSKAKDAQNRNINASNVSSLPAEETIAFV